MGTNRNTQIIALIALVLATAGISIGFAAFSRTLTIQPTLNVKPTDETFKVRLSSSSTTFATEPITAIKTGPSHANFEASQAIIGTVDNETKVNSGLNISGLDVSFSEPGQSVAYTFYVLNDGNYNAYLNNVTFATVEGESKSIVCTPKSSDSTLVNSACNDISYSIKIGDGDNAQEYFSTKTTGLGTLLERNSSTKVVITIKYTQKVNNDEQVRADGDFEVKFGSISLGYSTVAA